MVFLFAAVAGSTVLLLALWAGVTVYRLYNPENPHPFEGHSFVPNPTAGPDEERMPVGIREIRADQRRLRHEQGGMEGSYVWGHSEGVPEEWVEDLRRRRN